MARRSSNKIEPSAMTMTFSTPVIAPGSMQEFYIDLSQCASILNRRFYRQGLNWAVAGFKILTSSSSSSVVVSKLPNNWVTSGSWEKTMRAWLRQQNEALDNLSEPEAARFRDFKIHMDEAHVVGGFSSNLIPTSNAVDPITGLRVEYLTGEWEASQIVIPNDGTVGTTSEYLLHMTGGNTTTSKAMIKGYANSRNTPHSPDPVSPGPLRNTYFNTMFDVGDNTDEILDNATEKNDNLPYDRDDYPGETANGGSTQTHDVSFISGTTIGGTTRLKGGNFPCGLVKLELQTNADAGTSYSYLIQVDLIPGNHRGYLAESMVEM